MPQITGRPAGGPFKPLFGAIEETPWASGPADVAAGAILVGVNSAINSGGSIVTLAGEASTAGLSAAEYASRKPGGNLGETWGQETWGQTERFLAAGSPLEHLFCLRGVSIQLEWQRKSHIHVSA
jgi:hypothetical protein